MLPANGRLPAEKPRGLDEIVKSGLQWARMGSDGHGYLALVTNYASLVPRHEALLRTKPSQILLRRGNLRCGGALGWRHSVKYQLPGFPPGYPPGCPLASYPSYPLPHGLSWYYGRAGSFKSEPRRPALDPKRLCLVLVSPKGAPEQPATKDTNETARPWAQHANIQACGGISCLLSTINYPLFLSSPTPRGPLFLFFPPSICIAGSI
jgi:hypothetical protein